MGDKWKTGEGYIYCSGQGDNFNNMAYSGFRIEEGDFHMKMRMSFDTLGQTTSILWLFNHHFGFDSRNSDPTLRERLFFYSPVLDSLVLLAPAASVISVGEPFWFEVIREDSRVRFLIDQQLITEQTLDAFSSPLAGSVGIRPWQNRIRIYEWQLQGNIKPMPEPEYVFQNGEAGYACFRVPSIVQTQDGSLLAFAEGRENSCRDNYDVNIVMKKSTDNGKSWGPVQLIWEDSTNTCCYPVPIVDRVSGRVVLLMGWQLGTDRVPAIKNKTSTDTRRMFQVTSDDHGDSWSPIREITDQVKQPDWQLVVSGSGSGLQMRHPSYNHRMLIPSHYSSIENGQPEVRCFLLYSDDGGLNWNIGGPSPEAENNECEVAEISGGGLMLNMRKADEVPTFARSVAYSYDGGVTLVDQQLDDELYGPNCQGSLDSYLDSTGQFVAIFSNPRHKFRRENLVLQRSFDDGQSWEPIATIFEGYAGYSDLIVLQDGQIGCLFECGRVWSRDGIAFRTFEK